jgi:integrase
LAISFLGFRFSVFGFLFSVFDFWILVFGFRFSACLVLFAICLFAVCVSLHALRHTHASSLIAAGVDVLTISRRLGHASPSITLDVYGHLFKNVDDRAAQVIEALFGKVRGSE